jgi:hypothetical protein
MRSLQNGRCLKRVQLTCASQIRVQPIGWLWKGWLAQGKLHILAGAAGTGKTGLALHMAATLSKGALGGACWPDHSYAPRGHVVIWTGEDSVADTILPRLKALGADLNYVHIVQGTQENGRLRPFNFATDLDRLSAELRSLGNVTLVIIDSIVQAVAGDSNKNAEVRQSLAPVLDLAEQHNCAVVGITHFAKSSRAKDPLDRVCGSLAFGAVARVVMVAAKVRSIDSAEDVECVLVRAKSNIDRDEGGFHYRIDPVDISDGSFMQVSTAKVSFGGAIEGSARDILRLAEGETINENFGKLAEAEAFLLEELANGPLLRGFIEQKAREAGHSMGTLKRAKQNLGVISQKLTGAGPSSPFMWTLPPTARPAAQPGMPMPTQLWFAHSSHLEQSASVAPLAPLAPPGSFMACGPHGPQPQITHQGVAGSANQCPPAELQPPFVSRPLTDSPDQNEAHAPVAPVGSPAHLDSPFETGLSMPASGTPINEAILEICTEECKRRLVQCAEQQRRSGEHNFDEDDYTFQITRNVVDEVLDTLFNESPDPEDGERRLRDAYIRALDRSTWWLSISPYG